MATKLGRVVTYCEGLPLINLQDPLKMWSCERMQQIKKGYISTTTMPEATKLSSVVT